ncbi:MAG: NAD(P)H-hydrate dehydratase [Idiomarina sp.]|nr:NAD(P)H-hydrate dehydratase [Idiomarina sp.]
MNRLLSSSIPQQLYRPQQVRDNEQRAAELACVSMWQLMQRAGRAVFECLREQFPPPLRIAVLCGSGNNGGDGYIVATHALMAGYEVRVYAHKAPASEDAKRALSGWQTQGGEVEPLSDWLDSDADVVIDAMLGTGLTSEVRGELAEAIDSVNEARLPVIAVDIASGLDGDTGRVLGCAVKARHTVTMVALKRGLYTGEAGEYSGRLWFADLGILREFRTLTKAAAWRLDPCQLPQAFPPRPWNSHKGMFGHVVVIGGSEGMAGAAQLTALAALRAGAGKVSVICEPGQQSMAGARAEIMVRGMLSDDAAAESLLQQADVIAIGPGLGQGIWGQSWWQKVSELETPLVVDADALNLLAQNPLRRDDWVLTPHPGEAGRLLDCTSAEVEQDRWRSVSLLQQRYGGVVVLKGAGSLVQSQDYLAVNTTGNPGLASAGMGDTLTGIISALLATFMATLHANAKTVRQSMAETVGYAVLVHGGAADSAAAHGQRGLLAGDVIDHIRGWVNQD